MAPATGYLVFGNSRDLEFPWHPAVPEGKVTGYHEVAGSRTEVAGVGYHDHDRGNVGMTSTSTTGTGLAVRPVGHVVADDDASLVLVPRSGQRHER